VILTAAALSALITLGASDRARAADGTWNGLAADGLWQSPGNWDSNIVPGDNSGAAGANTDTARFVSDPSATPTSTAGIAVDLNRNIGSIDFHQASADVDFRIGPSTINTGNTLYLSNGGTFQNSTFIAGASGDITAPIQFAGATYRFFNDNADNTGVPIGATTRTFGDVTAAPGGTVLTLDGRHGTTATSQAEIDGALLDNPLGGQLSIVKTGGGVWEVNTDASRPSTYSGDTIINGGILRSSTTGSTNGLGAFSPNSHYIVNNGGTLRNSVIGTTIGKLTVNSGGLVTVSTSASTRLNVKTESGPAITLNFLTQTAAVTVNAPFGLTGTTPLQGGLTLIATAGVGGTAPITVVGSSTGFFDLGSVTRILDIGQGSDASAAAPVGYDLRIQGRIDGTAGFIKKGAGTLRFSGTSTSPMTGSIEIQQGTFNPSVNTMFDNSPTLLISGGTLHVQSDQTQQFGATTVTKGTLTGGNNNVTVKAPSFAFNVGAGDTARVDVILADGAGGPTNVTKSAAGTATVEISPTYTGSTTVNGGTLSLVASMTSSSSINVAAGTLELRASGSDTNRVIKTGPVLISTSGRLDLTQNKLITTTAPGAATNFIYDGLQGDVQRAYNFQSWDQPGLTTSMGAAQTGLTTIGITTGAARGGLGPTDTDLFAGQTITGASTLAMYTYAGDANLDGLIDGGDYGIIDNNVQIPGADSYYNGDFNYDGVIDGGDYGIIDNNIQAQGAPFPTSGAVTGLSGGVTAVPEPTGLGLVMLGAASLLRPRRRRCI
jgi:autotransporter-associated beta strand protein